MTWLIYETKTFFSIYQFSIVRHLESFLKCIAFYWFMASSAKKKYDLKKLKTFRRWVSMDFHGTKKLLLMVSHDLWTQNRNIDFRGI